MSAHRISLSKTVQVEVFRRDGWLCCWCKRPVIFAPVMKLLEREVRLAGKDGRVAYYHPHWTREGAPLLDLLGAVIDHIEAFSAGGSSDLENLATACNKCNGRKSAATLDKWGERPIEQPVKGKYGEPQSWDGLSLLFVVLAQRDPSTLTGSEKGWLQALVGEVPPNADQRRSSRGTSRPESDDQINLAEAIRRRFAPFGGVELELPPRGPARPPPDFSKDPEEGA